MSHNEKKIAEKVAVLKATNGKRRNLNNVLHKAEVNLMCYTYDVT